ncbi:MAG TPA: cytochrome P450 [Myxococcota bacterium]|nr:cytochrome P450 [Myxococcota bacterium]
MSAPADAAQTELDPFERFNRAAGSGQVRSPYPLYAQLRRLGPVVPASELERLRSGRPAEMSTTAGGAVVAVQFDAVQQVLRDSDHFSSRMYAAVMGAVMGPTVLQFDPPEHTRVRALVQFAFSRTELARWERELVAPAVARLIDRFAPRGRAELVRELTFPFPVEVIAGMMGVPDALRERFARLAVEIISVSFDPPTALRARQGMQELLAPLLEERRSRPRGDLISVLAHAEIGGEKLSDELIFSFCRLLAPAGAETTYRSSSNLLFGLLSHPEQLEALRRDRQLMRQAIEEGLRWEAPLTGIMRTCSADTEVCGVRLAADTVVAVGLGAANHDERRWDDPERFDIFRPQRQHIAFAAGPHTCLGMHLARMETRVVLDALLDRLPNLRLDPAAGDVHISGESFRAPRELPVVFDAR